MLRNLITCLLTALWIATSSAAEPTAPSVEALRYSVEKATNHARDWLDGKDFKSLVQSSEGLKLLAELLRARSDDAAWQGATGKIVAAVGELQAAARAQNAVAAQAALAEIEQASTAAKGLSPAGKPTLLPRAAVRPLMFVLDSVRADSKIALITSNGANAKKSAAVLSELGRVVSNARSGDAWTIMADDFAQAAGNAARAESDDPAVLKPLFRQISESCDNCHDSR